MRLIYICLRVRRYSCFDQRAVVRVSAVAEMMALAAPCWMMNAFAEIHERQPSSLEPYALRIVKGVFRFIRKHFGSWRKYLSKIQLLGLDKMLIWEKDILQRQ